MELNRRAFLGAAALAAGGCVTRGAKTGGDKRWYKGMLHCHSYWSDGRGFPEQAVSAYKQLGYDFMSLTDHNRLSMRQDAWVPVCKEAGGWPPKVTDLFADNLKARFPWAKFRTNGQGRREVRLTPYAELLDHFNEPGRFLLMPGVEVTRGTGGWHKGRQVHVNYVNLDDVIPSAKRAWLVQDGFYDHTAATLIRATREEAELLAKASGNPPHVVFVNHPQWPYYDLVPQDLIDNPEVRFFEVNNGGAEFDSIPELQKHRGYDVDVFWDVVNAFRARAGLPLLYGIASDDAHWYAFSGAVVRETCESGFSGNGYIRVRADALTPAALFDAMNRGDFHAACGLDLEDVRFENGTLHVSVPAEKDVACTVKFIVTKRGFDDKIVKTVEVKPTEKASWCERKVPIYSDTIGVVAKEAVGQRGKRLEASYALAADDLYVRARVESDKLSPYESWHKKPQNHPMHPKFATAWTQPYAHG